MKRLAIAALLALAAGTAVAVSASSQFTVTVNLSAGSTQDTCISETLSQQTRAVVQVVCSNGNFVSISPLPGQAFGGTHGGAYRFALGPATLQPYSGLATALGASGSVRGSITDFMVTGEADEGTREVLISF